MEELEVVGLPDMCLVAIRSKSKRLDIYKVALVKVKHF